MTKAEKQIARIQREGEAKQARFKKLREAIPQQPLSKRELLSVLYGKKTDDSKPKHNQMSRARGLQSDAVYPHGPVRVYSPEEIRAVAQRGCQAGVPACSDSVQTAEPKRTRWESF
jgi:hypothetical protein